MSLRCRDIFLLHMHKKTTHSLYHASRLIGSYAIGHSLCYRTELHVEGTVQCWGHKVIICGPKPPSVGIDTFQQQVLSTIYDKRYCLPLANVVILIDIGDYKYVR